ncbi:hypothetical protein [uncultured Chitinophaga sp.]|uniref:hypothetical protein n=1 Tax=uncultured Chitinophaga sp. TaxID=339340 RepID=UPI00262A0D12|nr:hypothetical protein [uncultured Chitinophaga sp.]
MTKDKILLLTIILTIAGTLHSFACSCQEDISVSASLHYSDAAFSGKVISKILTTNYDSLGIVTTGDKNVAYFNWREIPSTVVRIKVDKKFKGKLASDTITILTPYNGAACGYNFQVGQRYIVYATVIDKLPMINKLKRRTFDNKTFWTNLCLRTQNWNTDEENAIIKEVSNKA